jgi:hypothetical protein
VDGRAPRLGGEAGLEAASRAPPKRGMDHPPRGGGRGPAPRWLSGDGLLAPQGFGHLDRAGGRDPPARDIGGGSLARARRRYLTDLEQLGVFAAAAGLVCGRPYGYDEERAKALWQVVVANNCKYRPSSPRTRRSGVRAPSRTASLTICHRPSADRPDPSDRITGRMTPKN